MKKLICLLLIGILLLSLSGCGTEVPEQITVLTWKNYLPASVLDEFTEETGIKVKVRAAETNEEMLEELRVNNGAYDMVILSDYAAETAIKEDLFQKTDFSSMENIKYVNKGFQSKYFDKNNEYTLPYASAGILIAYDPQNTAIVIDGYDDLLAPELYGTIAFLDDENALLGISNLILGLDADSSESFEENIEVLQKLKNNAVRIGGIYPEDLLITGDATVGVMFTSELGYAMQYNEDLEIVYPNEGFLCSLDVMAIPKNSKGAEGVYLLMNYIQDPMVNGKIMTEVVCSTTNLSAVQFMDAEYRNSDGYNIASDKADKGILMMQIPEQKQQEFSTIYQQYFKEKTLTEEESQ